jgi:polar amino acid transport system substrate-binding protein
MLSRPAIPWSDESHPSHERHISLALCFPANLSGNSIPSFEGLHVPSRTSLVKRSAAIGTAAGVALALAACGSSSKGANTQPSTVPSAKADSSITVPAAIKSKGTITVATDPSYAPNEFFGSDNKTIVGMDVDLAKAIGQVLGLKVNVVKAEFASIIPGLASGKYDLSLSSFTDTKEREKTVDFVTYFTAGTSLLTKKGNPDKLAADSLCGKKVAVEKGTTQEDPDVPNKSKACTSAGKSAITLLSYADESQANLALSSGRANAILADSPVADYAAKQSNGQFEVVGSSYDTAPYGIAIPKTNGLSQPVLEALKKLQSDGTYLSILKKWGIADGALTSPKINGATS